MPDILRTPIRLDATTGLNLVDPVDRMRPGSYPFAVNNRCVEEGIASARPGYTQYGNDGPAPKLYHSIRRLNDPDASLAPAGYTYILGNGTKLDAGVESAITEIDTGYSGDPLSILTFRPEQSPESWAYVYDRLKQSKVRADGAVRAIGVAPPNTAPEADYGVPANVDVSTGQSVAGWTFSGAATAISLADRTNGGALTIASITYNSGTSGWCCIVPSASGAAWAGERMKIILNAGGGNEENVLVREIHSAISNTTVAGISYDSGTTGLCSVVLTGSPTGLARNSVITIGGEIVRVLAVVQSPDGTAYSLRLSTAGAWTAGAAVTGLNSWYTYTSLTHTGGESITSSYVAVSQPAAGTGTAQVKVIENCGTANNRPISTANDYLHISVFLQNPANVVSLVLLVDVDPATAAGTPFTGSYWKWTIPQSQLGSFTVTSGNVWVDISVPLSQGEQIGNPTLTFAGVQAVGVQLVSTGACAYGFDWFYFFGTYGPVIAQNAPSGYFYTSTFRDSTTGAASVPGPTTRYSLNPLREAVLVTPATTTAAGVDYDDIYREGGTLTDFVYIGSVKNNNASPNTFTDGLSDAEVSGNQGVDLTLLQPWPVLGTPLTGVVNVVGTSVKWVSGDLFPTSLVNNTVILLNGVAFLTRGQPKSTTFLELQADAGVLTNATYSIASPTLAGQPMPVAFGPLEGPFVPVAFALGDSVNSGTLYYSNSSNLDAASDQNTLELCGPTEPLETGEVWNGLAFAGSRENVYVVQYSFTGTYQFRRLPTPSGFWSRWAICRGPDGIYALGRDGIYRWTDAGGVSITDDLLYPLFPHDGEPAVAVNGLNPVDMNLTSLMRLSATDFDIRFTYYDTSANQVTLRYEISKKRWFLHSYGDQISYEYLDEGLYNSPNTQQILMLSRTLGKMYVIGGNDDNGTVITTQVQIPYLDNGDERTQKLYVDAMVDADQSGTLNTTAFFNNGNTNIPLSSITLSGSRIQTPLNISSVPGGLQLYRNISLRFVWTGGPDGPRVYAGEPSFYNQPYLSKRITTQIFNLSYAAWKHHRRLYAALISNAEVSFLIYCQNGRQFTCTIPSTGGQFKIQPIMLDQTIKSLAFAYQLDSDTEFALFPEAFTVETKGWVDQSYLQLAVFKA